MRRKIIWTVVALVLVVAPAVLGLIALRGDDSSSEARRAAALVTAGPQGGGGAQLVIEGITPSGKAIGLQSWSWGLSTPVGQPTATGTREVSRPQVNEITVTKLVDAVSPKLMLAATGTKAHPTASIKLFKSDQAGGQEQYLVIELKQVYVSSYQVSYGGGDIPTESISLYFNEISYSHIDSSNKAAAPTTSSATYNIALQKS